MASTGVGWRCRGQIVNFVNSNAYMVLPERIELSTSPLPRALCISLSHCIFAFSGDSHDQKRRGRNVNTLATYDFNRGKSVESSLLVPKHCAEHRHDERGVSRPLSSRGRSPTTQKLATATVVLIIPERSQARTDSTTRQAVLDGDRSMRMTASMPVVPNSSS
jgi:hypothetical protein